MTKKIDPDMKHLRAFARAFSRMSFESQGPALRWLVERYTADKNARKCAAQTIAIEPVAASGGE